MIDLLELVRSVVAVLGPAQTIVSWTCFLIGFLMGMKAVTMAMKRQEMGPNQMTWTQPLMMFITAMLFLSLPTVLHIMNMSIFGSPIQSASSIFSYAPSTVGKIDTESAKELLRGIVYIIQFLGVIAVCRGIYLLNAHAQGHGGGKPLLGPGLVFFFAGIVATNFPIFAGFMESLIVQTDSGNFDDPFGGIGNIP